MPQIIAAGTLLQCSMGTTPSPLQILPGHAVTIDHKLAATTLDFAPQVNIVSFGLCKSPTNPAVISATAAAMGVLTPVPCVPATTSPWVPGSATVTLQGRSLLDSSSQCMCTWAGTIRITQSSTVLKTTG